MYYVYLAWSYFSDFVSTWQWLQRQTTIGTSQAFRYLRQNY